jgi:hypothetical protein
MRYVSVDAETNGLYGLPFTVAAVARGAGRGARGAGRGARGAGRGAGGAAVPRAVPGGYPCGCVGWRACAAGNRRVARRLCQPARAAGGVLGVLAQ